MKPAGVFDVKYQSRRRDLFADWIQAGETFHLSEPLRALIARDCYPRFVGVNSFTLSEIKNWLRDYLNVHASSITYYNNRYKTKTKKNKKKGKYSVLMTLICYKVTLSAAGS